MLIVWYAAAKEYRPSWICVARLLGEHGIQEDTALGKEAFLLRMEARRRLEEDEEMAGSIRRGWCFGRESFRQELLAKLDDRTGEIPLGEVRQEHGENRAERIIGEELEKLGWQEADLGRVRKNAPGKLALAARLRRETTLSLKWIAARVQLGTSKSAQAKVRQWMRNNPLTGASVFKPPVPNSQIRSSP